MNTWERWCEQIGGVDLERKYNWSGAVFSVGFNADAIRSDFVDKFNPTLVENIAQRYLGGSKPTDPVVQELVRLKMVGVRREGTVLHWANLLLVKDDPFGIDDFDAYVNSIEASLEAYRNHAKLPPTDQCLWGTVDGVFERLLVDGPEGHTRTVSLRHTLARK